MKRNMTLVGTVLLFAWTAAAQDNTPRQEVFLGYDFLRANSATGIPAFSLNGGGGQYALNFSSWIGGVADIYAVHHGSSFNSFTSPVTGLTYPGGKVDTTAIFYQFGPRVSIRKWSRITPFFQILLGASSTAASVPVNGQGTTIITAVPGGLFEICPTCTGHNLGVRLKNNQTGFAYKLGGGLDVKLNKHLTLRPIGLDLQFTRIAQISQPQTTRSQYNLLYSTGVNFTFGGAQ